MSCLVVVKTIPALPVSPRDELSEAKSACASSGFDGDGMDSSHTLDV